MTETPDRATISIPADDDLDLDDVDEAVKRSDHATRSEWIRAQIRDVLDDD
jgi:metal-responsive CopG/Arc/MetJ family transcriptional regulator